MSNSSTNPNFLQQCATWRPWDQGVVNVSTFMFGGTVLQMLSPKTFVYPKRLQWQVLLECPISLRIGSLGVETASTVHCTIWLWKYWSTSPNLPKAFKPPGHISWAKGLEPIVGTTPTNSWLLVDFMFSDAPCDLEELLGWSWSFTHMCTYLYAFSLNNHN